MYKKIEEGIGNFHYKAPSNPEKLLYDFYFIISALGGKTGDQEVDFVLEDVLNSCVDNLQKHMIKALKYAIGAECRHLDGEGSWDPNFLAKDFKGNFIAYATDLFGSKDSATLYKWYRKYYAEYKDDTLISLSKKKIDKYKSRLAAIDKRKGKRNLSHGRSGGYAPSYYALLSAQKKMGISDATVGKLTASWFGGEKSKVEWRHSFGGKAWYDICKALESLAAAKTTSEKIIYIDHAYDLQHNTDSVFNKLRSYYQNGSLRWLEQALDWKRDVESLQGYYDKVSLSLKPFVAWVSKNLYNTTIQQYKGKNEEIKAVSPKEKISTHEKWPELRVGDTVVRGPDWHYIDQDYYRGERAAGIVIKKYDRRNIQGDERNFYRGESIWWHVQWESGQSNDYKYSPDQYGLHEIMPVSMLDDPKTSSEKWIPQVGEKVLVGPEWDAEEMDWDGKNDDGEYIIGTVTGVDRASGHCFVEWPGVYEDYDSMYYWEDIQPASKVFPDNKAYKLSSKKSNDEWPRLKKGDIVIRGPDWKWGNQDCDGEGNQSEGKILSAEGRVDNYNWYRVAWKLPNGDIFNTDVYRYSVGEGTHDIMLKASSSKVTEEMPPLKVGDIVIPGPDWEKHWDAHILDENGNPTEGVVKKVMRTAGGAVRVLWGNKKTHLYPYQRGLYGVQLKKESQNSKAPEKRASDWKGFEFGAAYKYVGPTYPNQGWNRMMGEFMKPGRIYHCTHKAGLTGAAFKEDPNESLWCWAPAHSLGLKFLANSFIKVE